MVSKASELLPDPDRPVITVKVSRGISTSIPLRLCSRAPRTEIWVSIRPLSLFQLCSNGAQARMQGTAAFARWDGGAGKARRGRAPCLLRFVIPAKAGMTTRREGRGRSMLRRAELTAANAYLFRLVRWARMPRYFFHVVDDMITRDGEGQECADVAEAWAYALRSARS